VPKTERTPKWMDTTLGWLPYAKTKDAIFFFIELLPRFYQSAWQFWPNRHSFRQAFVVERRRQWNIEKQLNELETRMSFGMSGNPEAIGSILPKNDRVLKQSDKAIVTENLKGITLMQSKVTELRETARISFFLTPQGATSSEESRRTMCITPVLWNDWSSSITRQQRCHNSVRHCLKKSVKSAAA